MSQWQYILHRVVVNLRWNNLCEHVAYCLTQSKSSKMLPIIAVRCWCYYSQIYSYQLWNVNGSLICKVGIRGRSVFQGSAITQLWSTAQPGGKSLSWCPACSGWYICCGLGASAIMPPPPPAHFFDQGHSFLSPELHPVLEGPLFPFIKVTLNSHHYLSKC